MRQFLFTIFTLILLSSCNKYRSEPSKLSDFIPINSALIIKTESLETLESDVKNNNFISELSSKELMSNFNKEFKKFSHLNITDKAIICVSDSFHLSIITRLTQDFKLNDSILKISEDIYTTSIDSILITSSSKDIIDHVSIQDKNTNQNFIKLYNSSRTDNSFSLYFDATKAKPLLDSLNQSEVFKFDNFSDWVSLDFEIQQDIILGNGVANVTDTIPKLIDIFKNTKPQQNKTSIFTPINFTAFTSLTFDNFEVFFQNLSKYNAVVYENQPYLDLFKNINEIGLIYNDESIALTLHSTDIIETKDALISEKSLVNTIRGIDVYQFTNKGLFKTILSPFVSSDFDKYIVLDESVIFSDSEDLLSKIITSSQNKNNLESSEIYKEYISYLNDESSMLFIANNENFKSVFAKQTSNKFKKGINNLNIKKYKFSGLQIVRDSDFAHINFIIKKNKNKVDKNTISQEFNIALDDEILNNPQIVKNHRNNQKEIVVQDIKNNLYLISNRGKVLWKKKLNGNILGEINQIDIYKNGRLQLAFATPKRVYILDRNGKEVRPFPMNFKDEITQPLSVFDYDNKKNYRLFVVQGKETLMMDSKGKTVKGFTFTKAKSNINTQPKHFRVGTKDYIVFASGKKLNILDRTGKTRIKINQEFNFSNNEIYLYKSYFTFTNIKGQLVQIDQKGRVNIQNLGLPRDHSLTTTSKTLVTLADNELSIKGKKIELDFGNYTKPKIFYLRDKIYVAITELQSQKAYLFDSQTRLLGNFPVYGSTSILLDNLDKDKEFEFVVKGESNNLIYYQIN